MEKFFEKYTTLYENDVITTTVRISRAEDHAVWKHSPPEFPSNVKLTAACSCTGHNSEHRARFRTPPEHSVGASPAPVTVLGPSVHAANSGMFTPHSYPHFTDMQMEGEKEPGTCPREELAGLG